MNTHRNTQTGKKALTPISKQYINSISPSPVMIPALPIPPVGGTFRNLPHKKYPAVANSRDVTRKCTSTNDNINRTIGPNLGVYANPQAIAVSVKKNVRSTMNDGSLRDHEFLVSGKPVRVMSVPFGRNQTYVSDSN
jgi:hypothetical protein